MLNPATEESPAIFVSARTPSIELCSSCSRGGRGRGWSINAVVLADAGGSLIEDLLEIAGAVDDDAEALLHDVLGERPLQILGPLCRLVKREPGFEKGGPEHVVVDDHGGNGASEEPGYRALPGARRARHLNEELAW
ncbi:hypothetical protein CRV24_002030 [Beauveria bassiana]|nr:hypothetical protein CRV24_002030 [Beauveria bassiana]KAH8717389.1 hypothetical protein HC256_002076 [Beauveria bassiana]